MSADVHILGVRHHGPGSARSVLRALENLNPQCVLVEGPPDAETVLEYAAKDGMKPPVALLIHQTETPADAVYYPLAEFSPEWQAVRWALAHEVPLRFMDLPQSHRMAIHAKRMEDLKAASESGDESDGEPLASVPPPHTSPEPDPLQQLAEAAGFDDGERWWEHMVESHREGGVELFSAICDAMTELRAARQGPRDEDEPLREAWMRRTIRDAIKNGYQTIAVVCGAWHAPALDVESFTKKQDDELLKGLPKVKTTATWVPWTFDRLTFASGYGAGVHSPGWYQHLWTHGTAVLASWMTSVARLLRGKDIDCSSAHVIEAVRLAESLAAMRSRPLADLSDIADATRSILCFDSDLAMRLIGRELLVGTRMGELPDDVPMVPLQEDLQRQQKRLRLKPEAQDKPLDLDLRSDTDRERSVLLHRLRLLGVDWGTPREEGRSKGTFREQWSLRWQPEFVIRLIDAAMHGNTVEQAAAGRLSKLASECSELEMLTKYLQDAMLADLGAATAALVGRIEAIAAVSSDITLLMQTLPSLASLVRYGNVRDTDQSMVRRIVDGMIPRITVGFAGAIASLNDEAAEAMEQHITATDQALQLLEVESYTADWHDALSRSLPHAAVHGLVRGRAARVLLDAGRIDSASIAQLLSQTLSRGNDPGQAARWLDGFLRGSGLLLIHDTKLLALIDAWVSEIQPEIFQALLPLLRRMFSTFPAGERRQIGEVLKQGAGDVQAAAQVSELNLDRARRPLPLIIQLLGGRP
jgi:hypothetical protein